MTKTELVADADQERKLVRALKAGYQLGKNKVISVQD